MACCCRPLALAPSLFRFIYPAVARRIWFQQARPYADYRAAANWRRPDGLIGGRALDNYPTHWLILTGLACMALGLVLAQQAYALWQLWLIYGTLLPVTMTLMGTLAAQTLVSRWFDDRRGLALGISAVGSNVGGIILPILVSTWLLEVGWRETLNHLMILTIAVVLPMTALVLRRSPPQQRTQRYQRRRSAPVDNQGDTGHFAFWIPFCGLASLSMAFGVLQFNLGIIVRDIGLADSVTGSLIALTSASMIAGKLFFGLMGDRIDHRKLYWVANAATVVALGLVIIADSLTTLTVAIVAAGISGGDILPLMGLMYSYRFGVASFGRVMGFGMLTIMAGAMSPIIAGWVYDLIGSYDYALVALIVLLILVAVTMACGFENAKHAPPQATMPCSAKAAIRSSSIAKSASTSWVCSP